MDLKLCRACCQHEGTLCIFQGDDGDSKVSSKLMHVSTKLLVCEGDGLPSHICWACHEELTRCHKFVLKCEASDQKLRTQNKEDSYHTTVTFPEYKPDPMCVKEENSQPDEVFDGATIDDHSNYEVPIEKTKVIDLFQPEFICTVPVKGEKEKALVAVKNKKVPRKLKAPLMCATCGHLVQTHIQLANHMRTHDNLRPYSCDHCNKSYKDSNSLKKHFNRNHDSNRKREFTCEHCNKMFYTRVDLITHVRIHTRETPFSCSICPKSFTQISTLIRHTKVHTGEKPFSCSTCGKNFYCKEQLKAHFTAHTDEKKHTCHICFMTLKYKNNLRKHILRHTEKKQFVCNHCGKGFNLKGNLTMHIQRIHSEKSGHCNICNKSFSNMEVHLRRHTGERPLKCELCPRSFAGANALSHHVNFRHKNIDKYRCLHKGCAEMFPSRAMQEFHEAKYHGTSFPYLCQSCSKGFYRNNDLARHRISQHKER